jgi:hypothetical protein
MDKKKINKRQTEILNLIKGFADKKLDAEYFELSKNLLMKLGHKRNVPFLRGRPNIWAGGIIYAIGTINFLIDKSNESYISASEIADYFNASKSTIASKSRTIKKLTNIDIFDPEFSTQDMKDNFPSHFPVKKDINSLKEFDVIINQIFNPKFSSNDKKKYK